MNWIHVEGTLAELRAILNLAGVVHVSRGVTPLAGDRFRAGAYVQESAIPLIQAQGVIVTVVQTQADIEARAAQVRAEQEGNV
jgi:hypothetical protein